jgi:hypothetical protein
VKILRIAQCVFFCFAITTNKVPTMHMLFSCHHAGADDFSPAGGERGVQDKMHCKSARIE